MLRFAIKKIKNKKWMSLCIVLGVSLLVAIFASHYVYKNGTADDIINRQMAEFIENNNEYPGTVSREYLSFAKNYESIYDIRKSVNAFEEKWLEYTEIPKLEEQFSVEIYTSTICRTGLSVSYVENLSDHIQIMDGVGFSESPDGGLVGEDTMDKLSLLVGNDADFTKKSSGTTETIKIVGIIKKNADDDNFWCDDLTFFERSILVDEASANKMLEFADEARISVKHHVLLDYSKINGSNYKNLLKVLKEIKAQDECFVTSLISILEQCDEDIERVNTLLYVLEIPIIALLVIFIYMISNTLAQNEEGEIAVLRSRGIKRKKIVGLYALQAFILSIFSAAIGIGLSLILCQMAASTTSFLEFGNKNVDSFVLSLDTLIGAAIAIVIAIIIIILPVIRKSKLTIVKQKAESGQKTKKALWEKFFVDVLLAAVSVYLFTNYMKQINSISRSIINGEKLDVLVLLNSTLFIFAFGLLFIRLIGYALSIALKLFRNRLRAWSFAALINLQRTFRAQSFIAVFIIITIANSIYNANLARCINETAKERVDYNVGCDLRVKEYFRSHSSFSEKGESTYYDEPDYAKYIEAVGNGEIAKSTKVIIERTTLANPRKGSVNVDGYLYAINTKEFGQIAKLENSLNDEHWYNALNALAVEPRGAIISRNLAEKFGADVGEKVSYVLYNLENEIETKTQVEVVAIVDAFPGFEKYQYEKNAEGKMARKENALIVLNYAQLVSDTGIRPYEVWMDTSGKDGLDFVNRLSEKTTILKHESLAEEQAKQNSNELFQITNGMFSINFFISIAICITGFLVYWIMTIRNRELIFGIYRAMGVKEGEVNRMLFLEQLTCSLSAAGAGVLIGILASKFFIKLTAISYLPYKHVVDIKYFSDARDMSVIGICMAAMFVVCMFVITRIIKHLKISEALKLGED